MEVTPNQPAAGISTSEHTAPLGWKDVEAKMKGTMDRLRIRNQEWGGQLFATFGNPDADKIHEEIFVFPTPQAAGDIDEFLIAARDGFMLLQVMKDATTRGGLIPIRQVIADVIRARQEKLATPGNSALEPGGLFRESSQAERGISGVWLGKDREVLIYTEDGRAHIQGEEVTGSVRLATRVNANEVGQIFRANQVRVEMQRKEYEESIKPHIEAAQQIDQMLGETTA